ncbi:antibiotic biosynthesis monooxygenase family protein [Pseudoxanthomonas suwonensis]|uniref:antibiotic biosynthesis monooxygenase family protein n=1 Tax=Pseudoxanthomonas suwonensis TaxID=314722 RepID=UPI001B86CBCA|nr:antibiotic biosynthesis monooxygenase [Pseudoxanthomonas suwonensis]
MSGGGFATLPAPPYYMVVFASQRNDADPEEYAAAAGRMVELARRQPGFLGVESVRGADGFGITVSYWESEAAIAAWRAHAEHAEIRRHGRAHWYERYELRVGRVERATGYRAGDTADTR